MAWEPRFTVEEIRVINHFHLSGEITTICKEYRESMARMKIRNLLLVHEERLKHETSPPSARK